jgi:hypothetical protein
MSAPGRGGWAAPLRPPYLDYYAPPDNHIDSVATVHFESFVQNWQRDLPLKTYTPQQKLLAETPLIGGFQQAWS